MFFESSKPVTGLGFFDRSRELAELVNTVDLLKQGSTKYLAPAILGAAVALGAVVCSGC